MNGSLYPIYTPKHGIDFKDTFSRVVKWGTLWILFTLVAQLDWCIYYLDVKKNKINEEFEEMHMY